MANWKADVNIEARKRSMNSARLIAICTWILNVRTAYLTEGTARGYNFGFSASLRHTGVLGTATAKLQFTWDKASFSEAELSTWMMWIKAQCLDVLPEGCNCVDDYTWTP